MIFLDTSALYALASAEDAHHDEARAALRAIEASGEELVLHTYVLLETFALVHRRHGLAAAVRISRDTSLLPTVVVDRALHDRAVERLRRSRRGRLSLVDAVSFVVMDDRDVDTAFAFDPDFATAGFRLFEPS
ncbi:MAG: PIN domain-containing protein [Deltaproteobacteria bacterium]|nr:PIN domain-containing protein [Deltaproteobacteria bacterium]